MSAPGHAKRLAVVFSRLGPYHLARLAAASRRASAQGRELVAVEIARRNASHFWEQRAAPPELLVETLLEGDYAGADAGTLWRETERTLERHCPDAVAVNGWSAPEAHAALCWCRRRGRGAILMSTAQRSASQGSGARERLKAALVRRFDAALVGGARHRSYLESLGMAGERITTGYNVVDNAHFARGAAEAMRGADARREALGLPERYFLTPCRFIPEKNLPVLLDAYERYARAAPSGVRWPLVIVGEGPGREALERRIAALECAREIHLMGFQSYERMPALYALAGALVLPSISETWGLVINEAFACGLPAIVSERCGAVDDLVEPGVNGDRFDPRDPGALAARLAAHAGASDAARARMSLAARERIGEWPVERFADGLLAAADHAVAAAQGPRAIGAGLMALALRALPRSTVARSAAQAAGAPPGGTGPCASRS